MKNKSFLLLLITVCFSFINQTKTIDKNLYKNSKVYNLKTNESLYLSDFIESEKLQLFVFHSTSCPFNRVYESNLDNLSATNSDIIITYVNSNSLENNIEQPEEKINTFLKDRNNNYLLDQNIFLKKIFRINKNGTVVLFVQESSGIKVFFKGPIDDSPQSTITNHKFLETAIKNALEGKATNNTSLKTGCRILNH